MRLVEIIDKQNIQLSLTAASKEQCIQKMVEQMVQSGAVMDAAAYTRAVLEREKKGTTGVGFGVAIPHGKSVGVARPALGFARLAAPVDWQAMDNNPVHMVFLIAVPEEQAGNEHLQILAALARKLVHAGFRQQLQEAGSPEEVVRVLETV